MSIKDNCGAGDGGDDISGDHGGGGDDGGDGDYREACSADTMFYLFYFFSSPFEKQTIIFI